MKKSYLITLVLFFIFASSISGFTREAEPEKELKKMTVGAGFGFSHYLGDSDELVDFSLPLAFSFQCEIASKFSIELDAVYSIYVKEGDEAENYGIDDIEIKQLGMGFRCWIKKAFDGAYFGAGCAQARIKYNETITYPIFINLAINVTESYSYINNVLVFKGGYVLPISNGKQEIILLDFGGRYDIHDDYDIDRDALGWSDQPVSLYAMAHIRF